MEYKRISDRIIIRLEKGEKLSDSIIRVCKEQDIRLGYLMGVGAVSRVELAHYTLENKEYSSKEIDAPLEIASLHGNITMLGSEPYIHIHGLFTNEKMEAFGGHVRDFVTGPTCEIILLIIEGIVDRKHSEEIGLNLMDITENIPDNSAHHEKGAIDNRD